MEGNIIKRIKLLIKILVPVILIASGVAYYFASAVWDETTAVHITPSEIENSTLAIGTHLIHLSALTEELYNIAMDSADESGQNSIYYKSELGDGTWFDITTASSLDDITSSKGTPVDDSVIAALFFTHHTKSDGVTYDLRTGKAVSIQDIKDPYELESMDELLPLKTRYELIKEEQADSEEGKAKIARIEQFFATVVKDSVTDDCDAKLKALQVYYDVLSANNGSDAEMSAVQEVMDTVDATRRAQVFTVVKEALNTYSVELQQVSDTGSSGSDTNLQSAVNDSLSNVTDSLTEYEGKLLSEGTTIMSKVKYKTSTQLITDAEAPDHSACDVDVANLIALDNIMNGVVAAKDTELSFLDDTLLPQATDQYLNGLKAGENADYGAAVAANSSHVVLDGITDTNTSTLNTYRNELEFYITAETLRLDNSAATDFISARLEQTYTYSATVPDDAFAEGANETVDDHITFLTDKLRELELAAGGNELDQLTAQKDDLQTEYLAALDDNDLEAASKLEDQIAELDEQIQSLEDSQNNQLAELQSDLSDLNDQLDAANSGGDTDLAAGLKTKIAELEGEISTLESGMTDGTLGNVAAALKIECLDFISGGEGSSDDLSNDIEALSNMLELDSKAVFPVLKDIHEAMVNERDVNGDDSFDDEIAAVEEVILNNKAAYDDAMRSELEAADFEAVAESFFAEDSGVLESGQTDAGSSLTGGEDGDASDLSSDEQAIVNILALKLYYEETGSDEALSLMGVKTQNQTNLGSPMVFDTVDDVSAEFLPVTAVSGCTDMRYIWKSMDQATLANGGDYYVFTVYSDIVQRSRDGEKSDTMTVAAKYKSVVYIPDDYTYKEFGIEAVYIQGTDYGVVSSDELQGFAVDLFNEFLTEASSRVS